MKFKGSKIYLLAAVLIFSVQLLAANPPQPFLPSDNIQDPNCTPADSNCYVNVGVLSETVTGLDFSSSTNVLSLSSGYTIPLVASTTQWSNMLNNFSTTSRSLISSSATGLTYSTTTGALSLSSGYTIPLTASTTAWNTFLTSSSTILRQNGNSFGTALSIGTNDNNNLYFETNNTGRMEIDTNGDVGIGTTPSGGTRLTVNGNAWIQGDLNAGVIRANSIRDSYNDGSLGEAGYVLSSLGSEGGTRWIPNSGGGSLTLDDVLTLGNDSTQDIAVGGVNLRNPDSGLYDGRIFFNSTGFNFQDDEGGYYDLKARAFKGGEINLDDDGDLASGGNFGSITMAGNIFTFFHSSEVYANLKAGSFIKEGGTSGEFLMADGSTSAGAGALLQVNGVDNLVQNILNLSGDSDAGITVSDYGDGTVRIGLNTSGGLKVFDAASEIYGTINLSNGVYSFTSNGSSAANISASAFIVPDGTSEQFLMADGSVSTGGGSFWAELEPGFLDYTSESSSMIAANSFSGGHPSGYLFYKEGTPFAEISVRENSADLTFTVAGAERMRITDGGEIGIGVADPLDKLHVFGDLRLGAAEFEGCVKDFSGTGIVGNCSSDERLKTNILDLQDDVLDKLNNIRTISYQWNDTAKDLNRVSTETTNYGLLAQNVEQYFPELVSTDKSGYKRVNYTRIPFYLIKAIQELSNKVASLAEVVNTKKVQTKELCIEEVCVTKSQLQQMLQNQNVQNNYSVPVVETAPVSSSAEPIVEVTASSSEPMVDQDQPAQDPVVDTPSPADPAA